MTLTITLKSLPMQSVHCMLIIRKFSSLKSSSLPLDNASKLKIYSYKFGRGFRLTSGAWQEGCGLALIGANHFKWKAEGKENVIGSIEALLRVLRPIPEILVIGLNPNVNNNGSGIVSSSGSAINTSNTTTNSINSNTTTKIDFTLLKKEFGCNFEVSDPVNEFNTLILFFSNLISLSFHLKQKKITAAHTFNALIDDDRRVIGLFHVPAINSNKV
jgi:hypothetical protein